MWIFVLLVVLILLCPVSKNCGTLKWPTPRSVCYILHYAANLRHCAIFQVSYPVLGSLFTGRSRKRVVITTSSGAREFYSQAVIHRPRDFGVSWVLAECMGSSLFTSNGEQWSRIVAPFKSHFAPRSAAELSDKALDLIDEWLVQIAEQAKAKGSAQVTFQDLLDLTFRIVVRAFYGEEMEKEGKLDPFLHEFDALTAATFTSWLAVFPIFQFIPNPLLTQIRSYQRKWSTFNSSFRATLRELGNKAPHCILQDIEEKMAENQFQITENELNDTLAEMVLGNADFVAAAIAWPLLFLSKDSETVQRISDGDEELLKSAITESWRLEPILTVTNAVTVCNPITVGGIHITPGTEVVFDTKAINRSPLTWKNPNEFQADRFYQQIPPQYSLHIFGLGTRKCLGQHYALQVCQRIIHRIVCEYSIDVILSAENNAYGPFQFPPVAAFSLTKRM